MAKPLLALSLSFILKHHMLANPQDIKYKLIQRPRPVKKPIKIITREVAGVETFAVSN
jgi:hypothetical protein